MKAQVISEFGPPSVFHPAQLPKPKAGAGEVVIEVRATSVNPIDCKIRAGLVPEISPALPAVLHGDVAGVVVEAGQNTPFQAGDEVYACAGGVQGTGGALAEFMLADARSVALKPRSLSFEEAAALPLAAITAWTALHRAQLRPKQSILIHGGTGGVGHVAVQLARWAGAHVAATVGSEGDFGLVRTLGAHDMANYKSESVESYVQRMTQGRGFDVVFDTVGGKNLSLSFQAAAIDGTVVTTAARCTADLSPMHNKSLTLHAVFVLLPLIHRKGLKSQGEILERVAELVDAGDVRPLIDPIRFSLQAPGQAHEYLESGKAKGKVVLS